jgi:23S rRNA pseudouridine2605 synthase
MANERLQKILAQAGIASRRKAESLITAGRVTVDGKVVTELGTRADPRKDRIEVDGRRIALEPLVYLVFHKPRNVVSTMHDPEGRPTVAEYLRRITERVVPVGRLDFHTSGTLLLTNDGDLAMALLHPRKSSPKTYVAKVSGVVGEDDLEKWEQSIEIDGRATRPAEVRVLRVEGDKTWLEIVLREGRNRQIHRLGEATGFPVMRLARTTFAGITSEGLRPGEWRHLTSQELVALQREYGVPKRIHAPPPSERQRPVRGGPPRPTTSPGHPSVSGTGPRGESMSRHRERAGRPHDRKGPPAATSANRSSPRRAHEPRRAPAGPQRERAPSRRR